MGMSGVIYKIENKVNGKVYVGQTRNYKRRKEAHLYELRSKSKRNAKLQNAWDKYGRENFKFVIIEECDVCLLDEKEIHFIEKYDSYRSGYNMTTGGNQVMHTQKHTIEARKKMSEKLKAKWSDPKFKEKMLKRPVYKGSKAPRATKVICINDQKVFDSMVEAGEYYGVGMKRVSFVCSGKNEYTGLAETGRKLQFAYFDEGKDYKIKKTNHVNEKKRVRCIDTGKTYDSIKEAGRETGAHVGSIGHVCKGRRKKAGGLRWEYAE